MVGVVAFHEFHYIRTKLLLASVLNVYLLILDLRGSRPTKLRCHEALHQKPRSKFRQHLQCCTSPFLGTCAALLTESPNLKQSQGAQGFPG